MILKRIHANCVSESDQGVILIEVLISFMVISFILFMMLAMIQSVSKLGEFDPKLIKSMRLSSIINSDIVEANMMGLKSECLIIYQNSREISYCNRDGDLYREVEGKGYERILTDFNGKFIMGEFIYYQFELENSRITIPIWSKNE